MSFFSGEYFFTVLILVLAGALILGVLEKPLKWYNITVSILVIVLVLGGEPVKIVYFLAYFAIELAIVKIYEWLRRTNGRQLWIYRLFVLFSTTPLIFCKLCELETFKNMGWFQFIGISYLTFRVWYRLLLKCTTGLLSISPSDFAEFLIFFPTFSCGPIDKKPKIYG